MKKYILLAVVIFITSISFGQIDRSKIPQRGPQPEIKLTAPSTFELSNGLKVMVVENHKLPKVNISLTFDNPPVLEGPKAGVSTLTSRMLGKGTTGISKENFNKEVDLYGAKIFFSSGGAGANTLSEYFPRILELMSLGMLQPNFTQEELERERKQILDLMKSQENDVASNAERLESSLLYGRNHPYGEQVTSETLEAVTLNDVKTFYRDQVVPQNAYLLIVGDIKSGKAKDLAEKFFGTWKGQSRKEPGFNKKEGPGSLQISFLNMPNAVQSKISYSNPIELQKKDQLYFPALVANQILGGGSESRLFMNLREDKGYTYGSYSKIGDDKLVSSFRAGADVRNAVTDSAISAILDEVKRIRTEPVKEGELRDAKNKLIGEFIRTLEQPEALADYAFLTETEDLPEDFYNNYVQKLESVTAADVQRAAQNYFTLNNAYIVVAGKGSEVLEKLERFRFDGKDIAIKYYDKFGNETGKPKQQVIDPSVSLTSIYNKYLAAIGGSKAIEKVQHYQMIAEAEIQGQKLQLEIIKSKDGKYFQSMSMNGNIINKQVFDGKEGYLESQGQKITFNEEQKAEAVENAQLFPELIQSEAGLDGLEELDSKKVYVVSIGQNKKVYYDADTGIKLKSTKSMVQGEQVLTIETTYGDYREVEGILFPFTLVQKSGPQEFKFKVLSLMINGNIDTEQFNISG